MASTVGEVNRVAVVSGHEMGSGTDGTGESNRAFKTRRSVLGGIGGAGVAAVTVPGVARANEGGGNGGGPPDDAGNGGPGNGAQSLDNGIVLDWVDEALETARQGLIIPTSGRVYVFLGTVMYDAVNGIHTERGDGFEAGDQYAVEPDVIPGACRVAALAGAANEVLSTLAEEELDDEDTVDGLQDSYDALFEEHLDEYQDGNQAAGEAWGRKVA